MKLKIILALFLALLAVLAFTNPTEDEFKAYAEQELSKSLARETGLSGGLIDFGLKQLGGLRGKNFDRFYEHSNYVVCSIHRLDAEFLNLELVGAEDRDEVKFLGIAGRIIPLNLRASRATGSEE